MFRIVTVMTALIVLMSACSTQATNTPGMPATDMSTTEVSATDMSTTDMPATDMSTTEVPTTEVTAVIPNTGDGPANIMIGKSDTLGSFLQDDKGMTLYMYTKDTSNTSTCYDTCATSWLPLLTNGNPVAATGIDTTKLGTTERTDGSMQVTYAGLPLYYYAKDAKAGDTSGQNVSSLWFVVSPEGNKITK